MSKSPEAFRTISEVAEWLGVQAHVLRFWESRFSQIRPVKRAGGRRYYRPADMRLIGGIKHLLHDEGMTIRGVQKLLREKGVRHVAALSPPLETPPPAPPSPSTAVIAGAVDRARPEAEAGAADEGGSATEAAESVSDITPARPEGAARPSLDLTMKATRPEPPAPAAPTPATPAPAAPAPESAAPESAAPAAPAPATPAPESAARGDGPPPDGRAAKDAPVRAPASPPGRMGAEDHLPRFLRERVATARRGSDGEARTLGALAARVRVDGPIEAARLMPVVAAMEARAARIRLVTTVLRESADQPQGAGRG